MNHNDDDDDDARLIDNIVCEVKAQGVFDQFRRQCMADVDIKPAYQNLRQRVENTVSNFLKDQDWKSDLNKNQLREKLRRYITDSGFLETGVDRIVDQVVNPKINTVFLPKIEDIFYKYIGVEKPKMVETKIPTDNGNDIGMLEVETQFLPNDLEAVSPDSDKSAADIGNKSNEMENLNLSVNSPNRQDLNDSGEKIEDFESPAFEPIEGRLSVGGLSKGDDEDSKLSAISGLTSQDSVETDDDHSQLNDTTGNTNTESMPKINNNQGLNESMNQDSVLSQVSSGSRLSIITNDESTKSRGVDLSEEAQMPKFNENSSSGSTNSSGKPAKEKAFLGFDIKKDEIKFEGTDRRQSLTHFKEEFIPMDVDYNPHEISAESTMSLPEEGAVKGESLSSNIIGPITVKTEHLSLKEESKMDVDYEMKITKDEDTMDMQSFNSELNEIGTMTPPLPSEPCPFEDLPPPPLPPGELPPLPPENLIPPPPPEDEIPPPPPDDDLPPPPPEDKIPPAPPQSEITSSFAKVESPDNGISESPTENESLSLATPEQEGVGFSPPLPPNETSSKIETSTRSSDVQPFPLPPNEELAQTEDIASPDRFAMNLSPEKPETPEKMLGEGANQKLESAFDGKDTIQSPLSTSAKENEKSKDKDGSKSSEKNKDHKTHKRDRDHDRSRDRDHDRSRDRHSSSHHKDKHKDKKHSTSSSHRSSSNSGKDHKSRAEEIKSKSDGHRPPSSASSSSKNSHSQHSSSSGKDPNRSKSGAGERKIVDEKTKDTEKSKNSNNKEKNKEKDRSKDKHKEKDDKDKQKNDDKEKSRHEDGEKGTKSQKSDHHHHRSDDKSKRRSESDSSKKPSKKKVDDDHASHRNKNERRRSNDRDSNDGHGSPKNQPKGSKTTANSTLTSASNSSSKGSTVSSPNSSSTSSCVEATEVAAGTALTAIQTKQSSVPNDIQAMLRESLSVIACGDGEVDDFVLPTLPVVVDQILAGNDISLQQLMEQQNIDPVITTIQQSLNNSGVKIKKPKIASNMIEARKLMKVRKQIERQQKKQIEKALIIAKQYINRNGGIAGAFGIEKQGVELQFACVNLDDGTGAAPRISSPIKSPIRIPQCPAKPPLCKETTATNVEAANEIEMSEESNNPETFEEMAENKASKETVEKLIEKEEMENAAVLSEDLEVPSVEPDQPEEMPVKEPVAKKSTPKGKFVQKSAKKGTRPEIPKSAKNKTGENPKKPETGEIDYDENDLYGFEDPAKPDTNLNEFIDQMNRNLSKESFKKSSFFLNQNVDPLLDGLIADLWNLHYQKIKTISAEKLKLIETFTVDNAEAKLALQQLEYISKIDECKKKNGQSIKIMEIVNTLSAADHSSAQSIEIKTKKPPRSTASKRKHRTSSVGQPEDGQNNNGFIAKKKQKIDSELNVEMDIETDKKPSPSPSDKSVGSKENKFGAKKNSTPTVIRAKEQNQDSKDSSANFTKDFAAAATKKSQNQCKDTQRYSSDDLYKPRPILIGSRSRRRAIDNVEI